MSVGGQDFIGEIKVTRNLTLAQAFRAALGQLHDYGDLRVGKRPEMIMFVDQPLDQRRLTLQVHLRLQWFLLRVKFSCCQTPMVLSPLS